MLAAPVALFLAGGSWMMRATGRARFRQRRREPSSKPLNFRIRGYDTQAASAYWQWLDTEGRAAELRFLKADMVFPLWYSGSMLASMYVGWLSLGRPFPLVICALPMLITVAADWIENVIHIGQLARFNRGQPLHSGQMRLASLATSTKLVFFWISTLLIIALAGWVLVSGASQASPPLGLG